MKISIESNPDQKLIVTIEVSNEDFFLLSADELQEVSDLTNSSDISQNLKGLQIIARKKGDKKKPTSKLKLWKEKAMRLFDFGRKLKTVTVNCIDYETDEKFLTYDQIAEMAFDQPSRDPLHVYTITCSNSAGSSSVTKDECVEVEDGMIINCSTTSNA